MAEKVEIAVVTKTYAGQEGNRVKAGTRFAVGKEQGGLKVITKARYEALRAGRLVRPFGEEDTKEAPRYARPLARTLSPVDQGQTARKVRAETRARLKQSDAPAAPKQLSGPRAGSQTGGATSPSSSPEAPASGKSTSAKSGRRGTRGAAPSAPAAAAKSASSPSTTPTR